MFDSVGAVRDGDARRREVATLAVLVVAGAVTGAVLGLLGRAVVQAGPAPELPEPELVELAVVDLLDPGGAPDAPEAPRAVPAAPARGEETEAVPVPEVAPEEPAPLPEDPVDRPVASTGGTADGEEDGTGTEPGTGPGPGGDGTGVGPGGGGGPLRISGAGPEVKLRVEPRYPPAMRGLGLVEVACLVDVTVDPLGRPSRVEVDGCLPAFAASTEEALLRWRWYPVRSAGEAVDATFRVRVTFVER